MFFWLLANSSRPVTAPTLESAKYETALIRASLLQNESASEVAIMSPSAFFNAKLSAFDLPNRLRSDRSVIGKRTLVFLR